MANMTPTTNADLIPLILAQRSLGAVRGNTKFVKFVAKDTDFGQTFNVGETLDISKRGALTAGLKIPGTPIVPQAPAASKVSLTLDQHSVVSFAMEDVTNAMQKPDVMMGYADDAGIVIAEAAETYLLTFVKSFSNTAGSAGSVVIEGDILDARQILTDNKAPMEGRGLFVTTADYSAMLAIANFVRADALGTNYQGRIVEGSVGRVAGFDVYESQFIEVTAGPTNNNAALHREALTFANRRLPDLSGLNVSSAYAVDQETGMAIRTTMSYEGLEMATLVTIDTLYGAVETRDEFGVDLLS